MKYAGMPMGMWALFAPSFRKQLTAVFGSTVMMEYPARLIYRGKPAGLKLLTETERSTAIGCWMV